MNMDMMMMNPMMKVAWSSFRSVLITFRDRSGTARCKLGQQRYPDGECSVYVKVLLCMHVC